MAYFHLSKNASKTSSAISMNYSKIIEISNSRKSLIVKNKQFSSTANTPFLQQHLDL